jgi:hypothetical protein
MTTPDPLPVRRTPSGPFDALDADWALLCRRHRRSTVVARWARQEPALATATCLADVIPPPGVDRTPTCRALARLTGAGDDLAARALLQLLLPGLVRLAVRWRPTFGGISAAGCEVLSRAAAYIGHLRRADIRCSPAGYVLRSVNRDLVDEARLTIATREQLDLADTDDDNTPPGTPVAPSAEDAAISGPLLWTALTDVAHRGAVSREAARLVWLHATGHSVPAAAKGTGTAVARAYRLRDRGYAHLRDELAVAS